MQKHATSTAHDLEKLPRVYISTLRLHFVERIDDDDVRKMYRDGVPFWGIDNQFIPTDDIEYEENEFDAGWNISSFFDEYDYSKYTVVKELAYHWLIKNYYSLKHDFVNDWRHEVSISNHIESAQSSGSDEKTTLPVGSNKKAHKKRDKATQEMAAKMCAVSLSTIKKWDKGEAPEGYPGRNDLGVLMIFANHYKQMNAAKREARAKNRASTGYDIENCAREEDYE